MSGAETWLHTRREGVPARLHDLMRHAVAGRSGPAAEVLLEAACEMLATVLASPGERDSALPLLAADALLTHAFEAAAEDPEIDLEAFSATAGVGGRLGGMAEKLGG